MTGKKGAATEPADRYPNTDTVRWIVDVSRSGDCVGLDDGSHWHVVPSHRLVAGNWPRTLRIRVSPVQGRLYTLSAEGDRDVQAVYEGLRPVHEETTEAESEQTPERVPRTDHGSPEPERRPPTVSSGTEP